MAGIDSALGISPQVLMLRAERMNLLTANIANNDTPNYKARDIDFAQALRKATETQTTNQGKTNAMHFDLDGTAGQPDVLYRVPTQLTENGNTVEGHREHNEFMDNAVRYNVSLELLGRRITGLKAAIKGEVS